MYITTQNKLLFKIFYRVLKLDKISFIVEVKIFDRYILKKNKERNKL